MWGRAAAASGSDSDSRGKARCVRVVVAGAAQLLGRLSPCLAAPGAAAPGARLLRKAHRVPPLQGPLHGGRAGRRCHGMGRKGRLPVARPVAPHLGEHVAGKQRAAPRLAPLRDGQAAGAAHARSPVSVGRWRREGGREPGMDVGGGAEWQGSPPSPLVTHQAATGESSTSVEGRWGTGLGNPGYARRGCCIYLRMRHVRTPYPPPLNGGLMLPASPRPHAQGTVATSAVGPPFHQLPFVALCSWPGQP